MTVSLPLPQPIASYFQTVNDRDSATSAALFTPNALVRDEGKTIRGTAEIQTWRERTGAQYNPVFTPVAVLTEGPASIVASEISGTFEGSPLTLHFHFTLDNDKIAALTIQD